MLKNDTFEPGNIDKIEHIRATLRELIWEKKKTGEEVIFLESKKPILAGLAREFEEMEPLKDRLKLIHDFIKYYHSLDYYYPETPDTRRIMLKFITTMLLSLPPLEKMDENDRKRVDEICLQTTERNRGVAKHSLEGIDVTNFESDMCEYFSNSFKPNSKLFPGYYNPDSKESRETHPILGTNTVVGRIVASAGWNLERIYNPNAPKAPKPSVLARIAGFFSSKPTGAELDETQAKESSPLTKGPGQRK